MAQTVEITLDDSLVLERETRELQDVMRQGLILLDYLSSRISAGRFAELMGMTPLQAGDWLHRRGIAALRRFTDAKLEARCEENHRQLADGLECGQAVLRELSEGSWTESYRGLGADLWRQEGGGQAVERERESWDKE